VVEAVRVSETLVTHAGLHGTAAQKAAIFVLAAVRTCDPMALYHYFTQFNDTEESFNVAKVSQLLAYIRTNVNTRSKTVVTIYTYVNVGNMGVNKVTKTYH
jgi:hypothetical protein